MEDVVVLSPFAIDSPRGNSVSARRIAGLLREASIGAEAMSVATFVGKLAESGGDGDAPELLVALHARRTSAAVARFRERFGGRPVIVVLTGSDVHVDLPAGGGRSAEVLEAMRGADALAVAQPGSMESVPGEYRSKCAVVWKSVEGELPGWDPPVRPPLRIIELAHVRPLKDPFRAAEAVRALPDEVDLCVDHFGDIVDEEMRARAEWESALNPRYRWLGAVSRERALHELATAHILLNTALMEGGANSICEAIAIGVPVLATAVPGNIGMLGDGYAGLFPSEDSPALAALLERCAGDPVFLESLAAAIRERQPLFTRASERGAWVALVRSLLEAGKA